MSHIYVLNETFTNGLSYNFLYILSIFSIVSAILVIVSKNPIVSVLFLIALFLSIASYLMMLGINFIGLSYLLVYVGAVSILFLFILMLINVRISELVTDNNNSFALAIIIGTIFVVTLLNLLPEGLFGSKLITLMNKTQVLKNEADTFNNNLNPFSLEVDYIEKDNIYFVTSNIWDLALAENSHITSIGNIIYTAYPVWLILTSVILLLAMVGTIVITIKQPTSSKLV